MSLHNEIMNIPCDNERIFSYRNGFKDARHAASELAIKTDAEIDKLKSQNDALLTQIKIAQAESDKAGLIGMIGSMAWRCQLRKLALK